MGYAERDFLNALGRIVARDGVPKAMMQVAEEVGCGRATLYRHFGTREELLTAFMEQQAVRIVEHLLKRFESRRRFDDRLVTTVVQCITFIREDPQISPFFAEDTLGLTIRLASGAQGVFSQSARILGALLESEDGAAFRPGLQPNDVLDWLVRSILSLATFEGVRGPRTKEHLRQYVSDFVVRPLLTSASEE